MGFFSKLVGAASARSDERRAEEQLKEIYVPAIMHTWGLSLSEAQKTFAKSLQEIKEEAQAAGSINLPINYGDILLQKERSDPWTQTFLASARREGARDADIREWWNQHDLGRRMMLRLDDHMRMTAWKNHFEQAAKDPSLGGTEGQNPIHIAWARVKKHYVSYGYNVP